MAGQFRLCWINRAGGELVFHVGSGATAGRAPGNEIVVDEEGVSRHHCRFEIDGERLRVRDLNSTNGTYVNGHRAHEQLAGHGDTVLVGRALFEVRGEGEAPARGSTRIVGSETIQVALRAAEADDPALLQPASRVSEHLRTLCRVIEIINDGGSPEDLHRKTLAALAELLDIRAGAIVLGRDAEVAPTAVVGPPQVLSRTVLRRVLERGEALLANDPSADSGIGAAPSMVGEMHTRILCVPIPLRGEILGALYLVAAPGSRALSEAELRLASIVARALAHAADNLHRQQVVLAENATLRRATTAAGPIVGKSAAMQRVVEMARRAARSEATILITGETGTGKELFARAIHDWSPRAAHPFIAINCGAIPAAMVESELFGHEKGAFTGAVERRIGRFEMAQRGTLFLDEIGELPPELQVKLLRVLEDRRFYRVGGSREVHADVRVVAATHRDLAERVRTGEFREDLLYRIRVLEIALPALRERPEDILPIAEHLLAQLNVGSHERPRLDEQARQRLRDYAWPGNVRELRNVLERALILCGSDTMTADDVLPGRQLPILKLEGNPDPAMSLRDLERQHIKAVLLATGWNKSKAAEVLGIGRTNIYEKIKQYGLTPDDNG